MPDGLLYLDKDFFVGSESHLLTECKSPRIWIFVLSNPLELTFSRLENYLNIVTPSIFLITIFFLLDFRLSSVNKLIFRTCQLLSSSHLGFYQKVLSQHFRFFFPRISILHFLAIIFGYSIFLVNPSRTAIDEYCHNNNCLTFKLSTNDLS